MLLKIILWGAVYFLSCPCEGIETKKTSDIICKHVHAHLLIKDVHSACYEAYRGLENDPESKQIWIAYLNALARAGDEKPMMLNWNYFIKKFPEEQNNREVLESLAWSVINKGSIAASPTVRVTAMLGAFFSQDARGVKILKQGLCDDNSFLRIVAVKLSSRLMDASLQELLFELLKTEKVWKVRLEVIEAIGKLKIRKAKLKLQQIIESELSHFEEKSLAIESMVALSEGIEADYLSKLIKSNYAGMRMLACEFVSYFDQIEDVDQLLPLAEDHQAEVRAKFLQTLGRLRVLKVGENLVETIATISTADPDPTVALTAAWVLTIHQPEKGQLVFDQFLNHPLQEIRFLASSVLAATGKYGLALMKKVFLENQDIYVRMNLAIGLIGQRAETQLACDCLFNGLSKKKERWAWDESKNFKVLCPSKVKHDEAIANYPEAINQLTRLEILQILANIQYPLAQQAIKNFLKESQWGVSGMASALLLTEGDEEAVDLVHALLQDPDPKVKIQAALILALWGKGENVVHLLQTAYFSADRELKGQILEAIGRVGSQNSFAFLAERLQEPYQTLRIIAAAALLECLYK